MTTRNVWYTLVDACGEELSSADFVKAPTALANPEADASIDGEEIVAAFRKLVLQENPNLLKGIDASQLKVFANRAAFEQDDTSKQALSSGAALAKLGASETEVIVVQAPNPPYVPPNVLRILEVMMYTSFLDTDSQSSAQSESYRERLCETYDCAVAVPAEVEGEPEPGMLRCMVLDTALPAELVDAARFCHGGPGVMASMLMEIEDLADARTGIMLFKPLRRALDHFQIAFHYDRELDAFRLKLLDPKLFNLPLIMKLSNKQRKELLRGEKLSKTWREEGPRCAPGTTFDLHTTFGDLAGRPIAFRSLARPYRRCLNFHARLASANAENMEMITPDEGKFEDFWSEGMTLGEKMDYYLESFKTM